jgi:hypothetical protein
LADTVVVVSAVSGATCTPSLQIPIEIYNKEFGRQQSVSKLIVNEAFASWDCPLLKGSLCMREITM